MTFVTTRPRELLCQPCVVSVPRLCQPLMAARSGDRQHDPARLTQPWHHHYENVRLESLTYKSVPQPALAHVNHRLAWVVQLAADHRRDQHLVVAAAAAA